MAARAVRYITGSLCRLAEQRAPGSLVRPARDRTHGLPVHSSRTAVNIMCLMRPDTARILVVMAAALACAVCTGGQTTETASPYCAGPHGCSSTSVGFSL